MSWAYVVARQAVQRHDGVEQVVRLDQLLDLLGEGVLVSLPLQYAPMTFDFRYSDLNLLSIRLLQFNRRGCQSTFRPPPQTGNVSFRPHYMLLGFRGFQEFKLCISVLLIVRGYIHL